MQNIPPSQNMTSLNAAVDDAVSIIPLSPVSLLLVFGDTIQIELNEKVMALYYLLKQKNLPWIKDLTPAYASLGIVYDLGFIKSNFNPEGFVFDWVKNKITGYTKEAITIPKNKKEIIEIPVCFDAVLSNDLIVMSQTLDLPAQKIIDIFLGKTYHVFMLGFLPGFTYMGEVDGSIAISRKAIPAPIKAGAVGIAGNQTGIYPLDSPGGWHILGYTPFRMFDLTNNPHHFLQVGDCVVFSQINENEYFTIYNKTIN